MIRLLRSRLFLVVLACALTAMVVGGVAWALQSPVDGNGVVHACYNPKNGALHLDVDGACPKSGQNTAIAWNVQGPAGNPGPPGPQGPPGQPVYFAETTPDNLDLATVNGIQLKVSCGGGFLQLTATTSEIGQSIIWYPATAFPVAATLPGGIVSLSTLDASGGVAVGGVDGFVIVNQPAFFGGKAEHGIAVTANTNALYVNGKTTCSVTGSAQPVSGTRFVPLPIVIGP